MIIREIQGANFLSIERVEAKLDSIGLIGIQGVNADDSSAESNGSGKSSLVDLVNWTLWGSTARGVSGDRVIRRGEKLTVGYLVLCDESNGQVYEINRSRSKGKENLTVINSTELPDKDITLGTVKLTQALIEKIVGCSEDVFRAAVYLGQEGMPDLPGMTDKHLKELIEEAAGVQILNQAHDKAREGLATINRQHMMATSEQERLTDKVAFLGRRIKDREEIIADWNKDHATREHDLEHMLNEEATLHAERFALLNPALKTKLIDALALIDKTLSEFGTERAEEKALVTKSLGAGAFVGGKRYVLSAAKKNHGDLTQEAIELEGRVGKPCSECGTIIDHTHIHVVEEGLHKRCRVAEMAVDLAAIAVVDAERAYEETEHALEAYRKTMHDPSAVSAKRSKLQTALDEYLKRERNVDELVANVASLAKQLEEHHARDNPHLVEQTKDTKSWYDALAQQLDVVAQIGELNTLQEHHQKAVEVFGPAGVRAHILDTVTPFLNTQTSTYLSLLSDGHITAVWTTLVRNAKGELREKFGIEVTHDLGGDSFAELSGGEKRKVRLACALALQDLVASRATKPFKLWIGDEIDDALDDAGLERLMAVLELKAADRGSVLVISHNSLRDWLPNTWTMTKKDKKSTLTT